MDPLGICIGWLFIALWCAVALFATTGGLAGLIATRRQKGPLWRLALVSLGLGVCLFLPWGMGVVRSFFPEPAPTQVPTHKITDKAVEPFLQAINQSNRLALGFSAIPPDADAVIYEHGSETDVYISIGPHTTWGDYTDWHVSLVKLENTYQWVGERETYAGPNKYENIYISYYTSPKALHPHRLVVEYRGEDPRLKKDNLTLQDISPVLAEWKKVWPSHTPTE
jgi:hypothetical protein